MRWTKARKELESRLADNLRGRVKYFVTNYRKSHDQMGRASIVVDSKEIINMCAIKAEMEEFKLERKLDASLDLDDMGDSERINYIYDLAEEKLRAENIYHQYDFYQAVDEFLNIPIEEAQESSNNLIKILAILDKRTGRRRLIKMEDCLGDNELVRYFYNLRMEA